MSALGIAKDLLLDSFGRIAEGVGEVVDGLAVEELLWRPDAGANHVAWLVWHLSRQQDEQVAQLGDTTSAWRGEGWSERFGLPYSPNATGYGMTSEQVGGFVLTDPSLLTDYHAEVHDLTRRVVESLAATDYTRVIDRSWDPPVTVAVRLVSVVEDSAKHLGQAEYLRGLVDRRR